MRISRYIYKLTNACTCAHGSGNHDLNHGTLDAHFTEMGMSTMCTCSPCTYHCQSQHSTSSRVKCSRTVHTQITHFHVATHCRACSKVSSFCGSHAHSCSRALASIDTSDMHAHTCMHTHTHTPPLYCPTDQTLNDIYYAN